MLDEYRKAYVESAKHIPNWKSIDRNQLCRSYKQLEKEGSEELQDFYISAIILNFWHVLTKTYNKQAVKILTEEDCYECLIDSILYVLEQEPWEDPEQSIYKDDRGPEKAINITFQQNVINLFVASQRHKRKASSTALSLDNTIKDSDDDEEQSFLNLLTTDELEEVSETIFWKEQVKNYFKNQEYVAAFVTDALLHDASLVEVKDGSYSINSARVAKEINNPGDSFAERFSSEYEIPLESVCSVMSRLYCITNKGITKVLRMISKDIREARK